MTKTAIKVKNILHCQLGGQLSGQKVVKNNAYKYYETTHTLHISIKNRSISSVKRHDF